MQGVRAGDATPARRTLGAWQAQKNQGSPDLFGVVDGKRWNPT